MKPYLNLDRGFFRYRGEWLIVGPFVDEPPARLVVGGEAVVGDDFEGGKVAELGIAVFADAVNNDFYMLFGDVAPFDIGEGATDSFVVFFCEFGEGIEEESHGGELGDGGIWFSVGIVGVGGFHHGEGFDHSTQTERDIFTLFVGCLFDGFFYDEKELTRATIKNFVAVMEPGEEWVSGKEESTFELVTMS